MTPQEQNFEDYKRAEARALELLAEMRAATPKKVDIELALLVAIFELHRGEQSPEIIGGIIQKHMETIIPFYREGGPQGGSN